MVVIERIACTCVTYRVHARMSASARVHMMHSVEWKGGMEWWDGLLEWNSRMATPTKYCFVSILVTRSNMQQASQCLSQGAFRPTKLYVISYRYSKFLTKLAFSMAYSLVPRYEANLCVSTSKHNINIIPSHKIEINCLCMYTAVAIDAVAGCRVLQYFRAKN